MQSQIRGGKSVFFFFFLRRRVSGRKDAGNDGM